MNNVERVYVLKPVLTDPRFRGFIWGPNAKSVLGLRNVCNDIDVDDGESIDWQPRVLKTIWRPQPVTGPVNAFNDYPCIELSIRAISS